MFENRVLRRIFGTKRDGVTGEWRKLHNEELQDSSSPPSTRVVKSRRMRLAGYVARVGDGERRNTYGALVRKHEGNRHFGRSKRRWEDNIEMDLKERGNEVVDQIHLA